MLVLLLGKGGGGEEYRRGSRYRVLRLFVLVSIDMWGRYGSGGVEGIQVPIRAPSFTKSSLAN